MLFFQLMQVGHAKIVLHCPLLSIKKCIWKWIEMKILLYIELYISSLELVALYQTQDR